MILSGKQLLKIVCQIYISGFVGNPKNKTAYLFRPIVNQ